MSDNTKITVSVAVPPIGQAVVSVIWSDPERMTGELKHEWVWFIAKQRNLSLAFDVLNRNVVLPDAK